MAAAGAELRLLGEWLSPYCIRVKQALAFTETFKNAIPTVETLEKALTECSSSSEGRPFFGDDSIGYVDVALGGYLAWIKAVDKLAGTNLFDEAKFPRLAAWAEHFAAADAVRDASPAVDDIVVFYKKMQAAETGASH